MSHGAAASAAILTGHVVNTRTPDMCQRCNMKCAGGGASLATWVWVCSVCQVSRRKLETRSCCRRHFALGRLGSPRP
eukprot:11699894-Karenia_brevis.AAC.1